MQLHTPVKAQDDECDVNSQAHTRIEAELLVECIPVEYAVGRHFVAVTVQIPHITQVEERSAVEHTPDREAELKVCLQSHITHLYGVRGVLCGCVTWSQRTRLLFFVDVFVRYPIVFLVKYATIKAFPHKGRVYLLAFFASN